MAPNFVAEESTLYHYWRSSSSWRVRWALRLKRFDEVRLVHVDLLNGESESADHLARHPLGYVPVLEVGSHRLIESVAIIEWLDEHIPGPPLFPGEPFERAHIRSLVEIINADTQPLQNVPVTEFYSQDPDRRKIWMQHFIHRGLKAYETLVKPHAGLYSVGAQITAADLFLIPQCYNAIRWDVPLAEFPVIEKIHAAVMKTPEAKKSAPENYAPLKSIS